ncbi:GNAT family N-acetyltransferase [Streptomyces turgidiscabies]|uniref:Ribosomal-protein-alanine N-acetyltransferase n=1 Tax=Streptomyces turgidiscabies TaxID=85558 RepID=A0ABU0RGD0_9ACTN|nr:GNAT family N-acetyltransferase [Streptomyces turgidiscabies]MDQ0931019.1 ribosomal-protein-alanine N-acetyltransferase [Streptomyces turgidiscabies]
MSTLPADGFRTTATGSSPRIRQVEETDLPELVRLDAEAFPEGPYPFFVLRQLFDLYPDHLLVLDSGESGLQGYVLVGMPRDAGRSLILSLGVTRDQRGRGHGRQLMEEVLRRLREDAVGEVELTVEPTNTAAIELYRKLGFQAEPELRKDYFGPGADRLVMTLAL